MNLIKLKGKQLEIGEKSGQDIIQDEKQFTDNDDN